MSNQQDSHDEFGGFGESDDQTFLHDKAKIPSSQEQTPISEPSNEEKKDDSGFISYVQPDIPIEEEQSSFKKIGFIALATLSVLAILWMILPSNDEKNANSETTVQVDTVSVAIEEEQKSSTLEQDSIARVQDYLARMQMSKGKNIGNNERLEQEENSGEKAPQKTVVPPDPIPAKTFPEYREIADNKQNESIQKDEPAKPKVKVQKPEIKKKPMTQLAKKTPPKTPEKKNIVQKPLQKKEKEKQVYNETFVGVDVPNNTDKSKNNSVNSGEEYAVQVLSSISKQEADKALKTLKSKGISSAAISKKSLNGKTWYRVRFGSFEDRKKAQNAAKKAGYSNSWVDRIK
jgi:cell division protein FtsN